MGYKDLEKRTYAHPRRGDCRQDVAPKKRGEEGIHDRSATDIMVPAPFSPELKPAKRARTSRCATTLGPGRVPNVIGELGKKPLPERVKNERCASVATSELGGQQVVQHLGLSDPRRAQQRADKAQDAGNSGRVGVRRENRAAKSIPSVAQGKTKNRHAGEVLRPRQ